MQVFSYKWQMPFSEGNYLLKVAIASEKWQLLVLTSNCHF